MMSVSPIVKETSQPKTITSCLRENMQENEIQSVGTKGSPAESTVAVKPTDRTLRNNTNGHYEHDMSTSESPTDNDVKPTTKQLATSTKPEQKAEGTKSQSASMDDNTTPSEVTLTTNQQNSVLDVGSKIENHQRQTMITDDKANQSVVTPKSNLQTASTGHENKTEDPKNHNLMTNESIGDQGPSPVVNPQAVNTYSKNTLRNRNTHSFETNNNKLDLQEQCQSCKSTGKSTLRCLDCFYIECPCSKSCIFNQLRKITMSRIEKNREIFRNSTQADDDCKEVKHIYETRVHKGVLRTKIQVCRDIENREECQPGKSKQRTHVHLQMKHINDGEIKLVAEIEIHTEDPDKRQAPTPAHKQAGPDQKKSPSIFNRLMGHRKLRRLGIYVKSRTKPSDRFVANLDSSIRKEFKIEILDTQTAVGEYFKDTTALPLIVLAVKGSRLMADINDALSGISGNTGRIILLILHFKSADTEKCAAEVKQEYTCMEVVDCFLQEEKNNVKEVANKIKNILLH